MVKMAKKEDAQIKSIEKSNYNPENDPTSPYYKGRSQKAYKTFHDF